MIKAQEEVPALGHTVVTDEAVAPTCTETGLTEGSHCSVCSAVIKKQEVIPALGHSWGQWETVKAAIYNATGLEKRVCTVCGATESRTTAKLVSPVKKGKTYTVGSLKYYVTNVATNGTGTVSIAGTTAKKTKFTSLSVGNTVKISGITFKVTAVKNDAFKGFSKIKTVSLGNNIVTVEKNAFSGCSAVTAVTIGTGVKKIDSKAFYNCKNLKKMTVKLKKLTSVGSSAIKNINKKAVIKVPSSQVKECKRIFKSSTGFKGTMKISK